MTHLMWHAYDTQAKILWSILLHSSLCDKALLYLAIIVFIPLCVYVSLIYVDVEKYCVINNDKFGSPLTGDVQWIKIDWLHEAEFLTVQNENQFV